jgi:hypothetical protein
MSDPVILVTSLPVVAGIPVKISFLVFYIPKNIGL